MAGRVVSSKATKFYTYSRTARSNTEYATKMKRLSNQIFGEVGWVEKFLALKKVNVQVRRPMNASQAALVDKFASEPLEQSEMWVGDLILENFKAIIFLSLGHLVPWLGRDSRADAQFEGIWSFQARSTIHIYVNDFCHKWQSLTQALQ